MRQWKCVGVWQASADEGNVCLCSGRSAGLVDTVTASVGCLCRKWPRAALLSRHLTASDEAGVGGLPRAANKQTLMHARTNRDASLSTASIESSCGWLVWCVVLSPGSHLSCALPQVVLELVASLERNAFLGVGK